MRISFPYEEERSKIFGKIKRPVAIASFWSNKFEKYLNFTLIIDTGADYTIFPKSKAEDLGVNLEKECIQFKTIGIGGAEKVFLLPKIKMRLGTKELIIPVGFLNRDDIPPLLGRFKCLDAFSLTLSSFISTFN